jgi:hypothetical protein
MSYLSYPSGVERISTIEFKDSAGNVVAPTSAVYSVLNEDGVEIGSGAIAIVGTPTEASVTVSGVSNTLSGLAWRAWRSIRLTFTDANGNQHTAKDEYFITAVDSLIVGVNSFATFGKLQMISEDLGCLDEFKVATELDAIKALIGAWTNIGKLRVDQYRLSMLNQSKDYADNLFKSYTTRTLTETDLAALERERYESLLQAQCFEAEFLLGGNPVEDRRRAGFISDSSGESTQFFRSSAPLRLPVCREAMEALRGFMRIQG